jgi:prepilin-type N-terminal cleavage/methylation domain-containing protein/prepilin-type processing-associated H-X9-DG protein
MSDFQIATHKRAFTLIELLVVIAIIAILAAILFPVFAQAKAAAKKTVCLSGTKQIALADIMYGTDNDDFVPPGLIPADTGAVEQSWENNPGQPAYDNAYDHLLMPYTKNYQVWQCPIGNGKSTSTSKYIKSLTMSGDVAVDLSAWAYFPNSVVSFTSAAAPADLILQGDGAPNPYNYDSNFSGVLTSAVGACYAWEDVSAGQPIQSWDENYRRHNETSNYAMADGHAKSLHPSQTLFPNVQWFKDSPTAASMAANPQGAGWFFPASPQPISPTMDCSVFQYWNGQGGF